MKIFKLRPNEFYTYGIEQYPIAPSGVWNGWLVRDDDYSTYLYTVICKTLGFDVIYKDFCKSNNENSQVKPRKQR